MKKHKGHTYIHQLNHATIGTSVYSCNSQCHFTVPLVLAIRYESASSAKIIFRDGDMVSCLKRRKYENFIWVVSNDIK